MELYPLLPGESIELRYFKPGSLKPRQRFFTAWSDLYDEIAAHDLDLDYDCYWGCAPRVPDEQGVLGGGTKNISRVPVLWLDLDAKNGFTKEKRLKQLEPYPPTYLVDSGNGYHAYWVLDRSMEPKAAQQLMTAMTDFFQADKVSDPPHILRVVDTINHKDENETRFVRLIRDCPENIWNPEALPRANAALSTKPSSKKRIEIIEQHGVSKGGEIIDGESFEGRNKAMFDLAAYYFHQNWEKGDVLDHLRVVNELNRPPEEDEKLISMLDRVFNYETSNIVEVIEAAATPHLVDISSNGRVVSRQSFDLVSIHDLPEPTKPRYLWKPYFLLNRLVLLDGEEGIGKGLFLCLLASRYSGEHPFAWFTAEDDPVDDVNPRIRAARTFFGESTKEELNVYFNKVSYPRFNATNEALFDMLEKTIEVYGSKVLVFDPGRSFIGPSEGQKDFSYNNESDIRPTMQRLIRLSREREVAIIFVHHFNKNATAPLRHRTTGTGAWRQTVRQQVTMLWDYMADDGVFGVQKSNIGPTGFVRPYRKEVVDDWAVFIPSEQLDPAPELEIWANQRAKTNKSAITVIEPEEVVEQVRDWAFSELVHGDKFPSRQGLAQQVGISQESAGIAIKALREENWVGRGKGQRGGGYLWTPAWTPDNLPHPKDVTE